MGFFRSMDISASALTANRYWMDIIGENVANATNTRTLKGGPYRRKYIIMQERPFGAALERPFGAALNIAKSRYARTIGGGVRVVETREETSPFKLVHDPEHPDADAEGDVRLPNVDMEREMVDMLVATRSYEANVTVINNFKAMANKALQIGRG